MVERGLFITTHGIDGTGKSTLAAHLRDVLVTRGIDAVLYSEIVQTIENPFQAHKPQFNKLSPSAKQFYSLGSKAVESEIIRNQTALGVHVIKDRWAIDVLADNAHKGADDVSNVAFNTLLKPNLSVVLTCEEAVRMQRIHTRSDPTPEDLIPNTDGTRAHFFQNFLLTHIESSADVSLVLDSTSLSLTSASDAILNAIKL